MKIREENNTYDYLKILDYNENSECLKPYKNSLTQKINIKESLYHNKNNIIETLIFNRII